MSDIGRVHCVYCSEARKKCSCIRFKKDPELHHALVNLMWLIVFRFLVMMNVFLINSNPTRGSPKRWSPPAPHLKPKLIGVCLGSCME